MSAAVASRKTKIEDEKIDVETVSSDDEADAGHVHDENCSHGHGGRVIGRKERAARKEISKAATLKAVPQIKRVTFKRHNGPVFAISNAEVYYDTTSGAYVIYGQPMVETNGLGAQAAAAQRMASEQQSSGLTESLAAGSSKLTVEDDADEDAEEEADEQVDASGLDEKDITIVMDQAHVSRKKAIKALRDNNNDIVNTIMELTM